METRQIAYFLAACQQQNHALAAEELGIAPSTLSQSITDLEQELGLELFRLGQAGLYPTLEARALYQDFEHALRAAETAAVYTRASRSTGMTEIRVVSPLKFALGRLSKSAGLAARGLIRKYPDVFFDIDFALHDPRSARGGTADVPAADIVIEYGRPGAKGESNVIAVDSWFAVTGLHLPRSNKPENILAVLKRLPLALPRLSKEVIAAATAFCRDNGLPLPHHLDEDIGGLPRLARSGDPFCLLVPQSILSSRLKQLRLSIMPLPKSLSSPIVARVSSTHPAAREFIARMRAILARRETNNIYAPGISLKQMRYFRSLHEHRNMTLAARKLSVAQPALSCQLKNLERSVGTRLFERRRDGLSGSAAADRLATILRKVDDHIDIAIRKASRLTASQRHRITFGVVPLAERSGMLVESLTAAVRDWQEMNPGVDLRIWEAPTETLHKWVNSGNVNLAMVETVMPHSSRIDLNSRDPLGVVTASGAQLLPPGDITIERLADIPLLLPSREFGIRRLIDDAADKAGIRLRVEAEINSLIMAMAMIEEGRCATIMPYATVRKSVAHGDLQFSKLVEPEVWRKLSVIFSADRSLTEIERGFVTALRRQLSLSAKER
jgi:LysR family nitrogen assimilation transcriptional regulator